MQAIRNLEYQQCRTCYDSTNNLQLLTSFAESSPIGADKTYAQLLLEVCNINILNDKPLGRWPPFICLNCSRKLKLAYEFIQHSLKINQLLQSISDLLHIRCDSDFIEKPALDIPLEIKVEKDDLAAPSNEQKFQYSPIEIDEPILGSSMQTSELYGHNPCINNHTSKECTNNNNKNGNENVKEAIVPNTIDFISDDIVIKNNLDNFHRKIVNNMDKTEKNNCVPDSLLTKAETKNSKTTSLVLVCKQCNKSFSSVSKLKEHQPFCNNFQLECAICDQKFSHSYSYTRHIKNVHKNKILKQQTPKKIRQHLKYTTNIETNNSKEKTKCSICKKKFLNIHRLLRHERYAHLSDEEKIACKFCDRKFSRPDNYQSHLKRLHTTNDVSLSTTTMDTQWPRYSCDRCDHSFSRRTLLSKHEREVHGV